MKKIWKEYKGTQLDGFCHGYFGRDSYGTKTIVGIGDRWIVAEEEQFDSDDMPAQPILVFAPFTSTEDMIKRIKDWQKGLG